MSEPSIKTVLSAMQPTGALTLGNYLGALKNWVNLQDQAETSLYCVVDLHAITVAQDPDTLRANCRQAVATYLAAGINPQNASVFIQSHVRAHSELAWIFNCIARLGWLDRMTQFKDKAGKDKEKASVGLYAYPTLMASDILIYHATHVPVGNDQKQHIELTRDIAQKFNNDYNAEGFFPLPEPVIPETTARIMSLRDGTKKMSKSDPSAYSRLELTDDADTIAKKIRKAKTDPDPLPETLEALAERPEADNLVGIYAALADKSKNDVLASYAGQNFSSFKPALADLAVETLAPITQSVIEYLNDPAEIDKITKQGAEKAASIAEPILQKTQEIMGLR